MTIESKPATVLRPANGAPTAGKAAAGSPVGLTVGQGFAGLVSALSAQDEEGVALADLAQPGLVLAGEEEKVPLDQVNQAQDDTNLIANMVLQSAALPSLVAAQVVPESDAGLALSPASWHVRTPVSAPLTSSVAAPKALVTIAPAPVKLPEPSFAEKVQRSVAVVQPDPAAPEPVLAVEDGQAKPSLPVSGQDQKPAWASASQQVTQATAALQALGKAVVMPLPVAELARPPLDNSKPKSLAGHGAVDGLAGAPGLFDRWGISPTYAVVQASAVVPDTQVAETVSYWVTHGVQTAELTLDGLGSEPVEVHIAIDGNQTQVDFRTSQVDVRQAIEGAAGQLKSLLASQGLQLLGLSVGMSANGNTPGDGHQSRPALVRQANVVGVETLGAAHTRVANTPVGRALDLYV